MAPVLGAPPDCQGQDDKYPGEILSHPNQGGVPAPDLGEHATEVRQELLPLGEEEIKLLTETGVNAPQCFVR